MCIVYVPVPAAGTAETRRGGIESPSAKIYAPYVIAHGAWARPRRAAGKAGSDRLRLYVYTSNFNVQNQILHFWRFT